MPKKAVVKKPLPKKVTVVKKKTPKPKHVKVFVDTVETRFQVGDAAVMGSTKVTIIGIYINDKVIKYHLNTCIYVAAEQLTPG